ncbi:MAG: BsuPI-related putative proteinase inhibitor [Candidatus Eremiobacteraeota bacterium]|nr:BsuPI-related putative proteinase inhibitor [Candidatus Eremiobacteraeota bacterium]
MRPARKRRTSAASGLLTFCVLVGLLLLMLGAVTRENVGESVLPWSPVLSPASKLPRGINYQLDAINPSTLEPITALPQVGSVELRLALTNDSALPVTFQFGTSLQCEFIARKIHSYAGGLFVLPLEVWRSSYFRNARQLPSKLTLGPSQTKVFSSTWVLDALDSGDVSAGMYQISASFGGANIPLRIVKPL